MSTKKGISQIQRKKKEASDREKEGVIYKDRKKRKNERKRG